MSDVQWLFLDLNSFFASCEQQEDESLRGKPVAVVPSLADTTCCIAASYAAKAFGVKTGTLVREAKRLCPGLILKTGNHKKYVEYHHKVQAAIEEVLPVEQVCSVDEFACRLMGDEQELREATALGMLVKESIRKNVGVALTSSVGLAPNRFLAKVAADMQKPDGLTAITQANRIAKLSTQELQDMPGIGPRMYQRLLNARITSMAELLAADVHVLRSIWGGVEGEKFYQKLRGVDPYYRETVTGSFSHEHVLEPAFRNAAGLRCYAQHLTVKLGERLRQNNYYARSLSIGVRWTEQGEKRKSYMDTSFHETNDTLTMLRILNERLLAALPQGRRPFKVGITAGGLVPEAKHQMDMFTDDSKSKLSEALDTVNAKFGRGSLYFGGTQALHGQSHARISFQRVPEVSEFNNEKEDAFNGDEKYAKMYRRIAAIGSRRREDG